MLSNSVKPMLDIESASVSNNREILRGKEEVHHVYLDIWLN